MLLTAAVFYVGVRPGFQAPIAMEGPTIPLSLTLLLWYAILSFRRILVVRLISVLFALGHGYDWYRPLIARATAQAEYSLLLAATLSMVTCVVSMNRLLWRRLYRLAEERYRME